MARIIEGELNARGLNFAVVVSRFNEFISQRLLEGCLDALHRHGAEDNSIVVVWVPGAFEIPLTASRLAESGKYDAVICLGTLIRGSTPHFEYLSSQVAKGIAQAALTSKLPVIFGVITADNLEQAIERAGSKSGNKGSDAALAAMEMAQVLKQL